MKKKPLKCFLFSLFFITLVGTSFVFAKSETENHSFSTENETGSITTESYKDVSININLPSTKLELYIDGKLYKTYPIAIGMGKYPTPIQPFNISQIIWNPWWLPPDSDWAKDAKETPPGPNNPLGPVKMMMENGVRIHGTNKPRSIGHAASHACIRMRNDDAKELAWEIQKRYSEKKDESLLSRYSKNRGQSFYVKLEREVPVNISYKQVVLTEGKLILFPDFYGKGGFQRDLEEAFSGNRPATIDRELVQKLNKMRRKGVVEINLNELSAAKENSEMQVGKNGKEH